MNSPEPNLASQAACNQKVWLTVGNWHQAVSAMTATQKQKGMLQQSRAAAVIRLTVCID